MMPLMDRILHDPRVLGLWYYRVVQDCVHPLYGTYNSTDDNNSKNRITIPLMLLKLVLITQ